MQSGTELFLVYQFLTSVKTCFIRYQIMVAYQILEHVLCAQVETVRDDAAMSEKYCTSVSDRTLCADYRNCVMTASLFGHQSPVDSSITSSDHVRSTGVCRRWSDDTEFTAQTFA